LETFKEPRNRFQGFASQWIWRAGAITIFVVPARKESISWHRFLGFSKLLQMRAQAKEAGGTDSLVWIPGLLKSLNHFRDISACVTLINKLMYIIAAQRKDNEVMHLKYTLK
jgi:hypothetical protein